METVEKEKIELKFWQESPYESPDRFSISSLIYKLSEARVFLYKLEKHGQFFTNAQSILEIGAGQGWAAALIKHLYQKSHVTISDISSDAVSLAKYWENFFCVQLDQKLACKSYQVPLPDNSVDLVYAFQSAHHFTEQLQTLTEVQRILKPGGHLLYLHEPSCQKFVYPLAYYRVNKKRPYVPEDVLVYTDVIQMARTAGFSKIELQFDPTLLNRGAIETVYFYFLQKIPGLRRLLPCTADYIFTKEKTG